MQLSIANFQEIPLGTIEPAKPPSARRVSPRSARGRQQPAAAQRTRSRDALLQELTSIASEVIGSTVSADAPLMDAGLDSISAMELLNQISERLDTELPQTLLFDHPTLQSVADFLSLEAEEADLPGEYSTDDETTGETPKSLWDLHS